MSLDTAENFGISFVIVSWRSSRFSSIAYGIIVSTLLISRTGRADESVNAGPPARERRSDSPAMTSEQLAAFADLVGQSHAEVSRRLQLDSSLLRLATDAADARMNRRRSGKIRAAVGFGIFGVGGIASALLWSSAFSRAGGGYDVDAGRILAAYVAAAAAVAGLGVGISGIVVMNRRSQAENESFERYQCPPREASLAVPLGHAVRLPLLAIPF